MTNKIIMNNQINSINNLDKALDKTSDKALDKTSYDIINKEINDIKNPLLALTSNIVETTNDILKNNGSIININSVANITKTVISINDVIKETEDVVNALNDNNDNGKIDNSTKKISFPRLSIIGTLGFIGIIAFLYVRHKKK